MTPNDGRTRVDITTGSVVLVLSSIALAVVAAEVFVSARRIMSWVVACAVAAALIELIVQWLDRWMQRAVAIVLVLMTLAAISGGLVFGVVGDLDREVAQIQTDAPAAARQLERSETFGNIAQEVNLHERVVAAVQKLNQPSSGLAGQAVSSFGAYAICIVLTILFLSWGPSLSKGLLRELSPERATLVRHVTERAFERSRRYATLAIMQSAVVGVIGWGACRYAEVPAPFPLALSLCALSLVPNLGIAIGSLPILLLTFGLGTTSHGIQLTILFILLQVVSSIVVQPRIVRRSGLYVGPAVTSIAALIGFELYGIGGALYATALLVLAVAAIDSVGEQTPRTPHQSADPNAPAITTS